MDINVFNKPNLMMKKPLPASLISPNKQVDPPHLRFASPGQKSIPAEPYLLPKEVYELGMRSDPSSWKGKKWHLACLHNYVYYNLKK